MRGTLAALAAAALVTAGSPGARAWTERAVEVPAGTQAGAVMHGTVTLPDGDGRVPGVVIIAGSGPTDRDGNSHLGARVIANDSLKLLAHGLAQRGIASVRYDKRGVAASRAAATREEDLLFDGNVTDAALWLDALAAEPRVDRPFVIGHSEGALVGTLLARKRPLAGIVLLAGTGERIGETLRRQVRRPPAPPAEVLAEIERILSALERGELVPDVPKPLYALFRPSVQPYMISWLKLDPVAELRAAAVPALVVVGTTDIQVTVDDARRLAAATRSGAPPTLIEGMNHVLKPAPAAPAAQGPIYADPSIPLAPGLVDALAAFVAVPR